MNQLNPKQTTLKSTITISGVGLHTGANVTLTLNPAAENHGYKFRRVDLEGSPIIEADCDLVTDTSRGTTLTKGNASVSTVEHVLAALVGMEVDNVLIDIDGPEMPIMDGSSRPFVDFIEANEIVELVEKPKEFVSDLAVIGIYYFKDVAVLKNELQLVLDNNIIHGGEYQINDGIKQMMAKGMKFVPGEVAEWMDCGNKDVTVETNTRKLGLLHQFPFFPY